jgi:hypothetical protein
VGRKIGQKRCPGPWGPGGKKGRKEGRRKGWEERLGKGMGSWGKKERTEDRLGRKDGNIHGFLSEEREEDRMGRRKKKRKGES